MEDGETILRKIVRKNLRQICATPPSRMPPSPNFRREQVPAKQFGVTWLMLVTLCSPKFDLRGLQDLFFLSSPFPIGFCILLLSHNIRGKFLQGILDLVNPNLGSNSGMRIFEPRILAKFWGQTFCSYCSNKRATSKIGLKKFTA